jgi:hypothetical protein
MLAAEDGSVTGTERPPAVLAVESKHTKIKTVVLKKVFNCIQP